MIVAHRIEDTSDFHCWLSEQTNLTIRTNYADKTNPVTYIGEMSEGVILKDGGYVVINDVNLDILVMDEDMVRQAVIEYYKKYILTKDGVCDPSVIPGL